MGRRTALRGDFDRFRERLKGRSAGSWVKALANPGMQAIIVHRFGSWQIRLPPLLRWPLEPLYCIAYLLIQCLWGIQLPRTAKIGPGLHIGHFGGIIVSAKAVIGANCALMQGVTIGLSGRGAGCGVPEIGNDVFIGPGAKLFGKIRVGHNVMIGANAVVHKDVPDHAVVALTPGFQIISYAGNHRRTPSKAAAQFGEGPLATVPQAASTASHAHARGSRWRAFAPRRARAAALGKNRCGRTIA